jgi:hypothetical protein
MKIKRPSIPQLFCSPFTVDASAPFQRHLNRLEVEIGREDYRHLKRVELLSEIPPERVFASMEEITERVLASTQNLYNRDLLIRLGIRVYLDVARYSVYYRFCDRAVRFSAAWRRRVLHRFFDSTPTIDTGWLPCGVRLPHFESRFLPDKAGGVLLLRKEEKWDELPLVTATHGPYDPHTLEATLFFLTTARGGAAIINLGFSGREPLSDENLEKLKEWGIPLNPSNIDVIYPYADASGHPYCYKLEEGLHRYWEILAGDPPELIIDLHGCVGIDPDDRRFLIGLGGHPPYHRPESFGALESGDKELILSPNPLLRRGLDLLRGISGEICVQFCASPHLGYHFDIDGRGQLVGRALDPRKEVKSLLPGEERTWLPGEDVRWLPGAGGNALQRIEARRMREDALCLHVEIPTALRRRIALKLKEEAIAASLDASAL